jgi:aspartate carbamoyltransferase catalytic subunit
MFGGNHQFGKMAWDDFSALSSQEKSYFFNCDHRPYHTLIAQQFSREMLDDLCSLSTMIRRIAKNKPGMHFLNDLLSHKRAMLYFSQPSSRTFLSFYSACQILGMHMAEVRDSSTSSEMKGESLEDSVRTFSSYVDLIIMRSPLQGFAEKMAWLLSNTDRPVPIVNAGSGKDQHPTQALLDIYTLQRSFERYNGIQGLTVMFVGDLLRGRTARSLASLLTKYEGVKLLFVAPEQLQIGEDVQQELRECGVEFELSSDFKGALPKADAVYMTRIQDEWDSQAGESERINIRDFHFRREHLPLLKPSGIIMHPLPRREDISTDVDMDHRAMYWRQVRNGMWIRCALMATTFGVECDIRDYYRQNYA